MKRFYCSALNSKTLPQFLALLESLTVRENVDFEMYAVCMDDESYKILSASRLAYLRPLEAEEVLFSEREFLRAAQARYASGLLWICIPSIVLNVMESLPELDSLIYIDPRAYFFSSPQAVFDEKPDYEFLLTEYRFPRDSQELNRWGRFNPGFMAVRRTSEALAQLRILASKSIHSCAIDVQNSGYGYELYLNDLAHNAEGVHVLASDGVGVGTWNHYQHRFTRPSHNYVLVDQSPLSLFHFRGFEIVSDECFIPSEDSNAKLSAALLELCFLPYIESMRRAIRKIVTLSGTEWVERTLDQTTLSEKTIIISNALIKRLPIPTDRTVEQLSEGWSCIVSGCFSESELLYRESNPH